MSIPTAITQPATNIGNTTARINGKITDDGGASCEARFRYKEGSPVSAAVTGHLCWTEQPIAEYKDVTAYLYIPVAAPYAHIESDDGVEDFEVPSIVGTDLIGGYFGVLTDRETLWITFRQTSTEDVRVNKYSIGVSSLTLISSTSFGDYYSRAKGLILLESGKLVLAWSQQQVVDDTISIYFAYTDSSWTWHELSPQTVPAQNTGMRGACICQHPADDSIWWFNQNDSIGIIRAIHLVESGETISFDWKDESFILDTNVDLACHGENPIIRTVASTSRNAIILAYQREKERLLISVERFAKPVFVKVNSDATKEYLFFYDRYIERVGLFDIGLDSRDDIWVAVGAADIEELTWNDLYLGDISLGELHDGIPANAGVYIAHSSKQLIAWMSDDKVYSYSLSRNQCDYVKELSPTGYVDPDTQWTDEYKVYDENGNTFAYDAVLANTWSSWLEITHSAINCRGIWFYYNDSSLFTAEQLDVYYDSAWHNIYDSHFTTTKWNYIPIPAGIKEVTAVRFRGKRSTDGNVILAEIDFGETVPTSAEWTETGWQNTLVTDSTFYKDLTGLDEVTEYEFQTQAKNSAGEGVWSASAYFETKLLVKLIAPAKDTRIHESLPDTNYGSSGYLALYDRGGTGINIRALLEFSLSSLPPGSEITSAGLQLYYYQYAADDPVGKTAWAYKLTRVDWEELQATWNKYKTANDWTASGGDYVTSDPSGGSTVFPSGYGWMTWDVRDIVEDAYNNDKAAEFLVRFETEGLVSGYSMPSFVSKDDSANPDYQPKLLIGYTIVPIATEFGRLTYANLEEFGRYSSGVQTEFGRLVHQRAAQHINRVYTALLGLLTTGTRTAAVSRTKTALLGLLPVASRTLTLARSKTALLGLKVTASYDTFAVYIRTATVLLGLKVTSARAIVLSRSDTALLGLKAIVSRSLVLTRSKEALLGLKTTASRTVAFTRAKTALLGLTITCLISIYRVGKWFKLKLFTQPYHVMRLFTEPYHVMRLFTEAYHSVILWTGGKDMSVRRTWQRPETIPINAEIKVGGVLHSPDQGVKVTLTSPITSTVILDAQDMGSPVSTGLYIYYWTSLADSEVGWYKTFAVGQDGTGTGARVTKEFGGFELQ